MVQVKTAFKNSLPLLFVLIAYVVFLHRFAQKQFEGNITGFSYISRHYPVPTIWNDKTYIRDDAGYDGMFYYYIAHDPFIRTGLFTYFKEGWAAYRYQRVAYPLAVFLLSGGYPPLIPYMMVIVNLLAVLLGVYFMMKIAGHYNRNRWVAVLYGFLPGLFIAATRNLTEPLQMALICGGIYFYICRKSLYLSALFIAAASLAKDTALLVSAAFFLYEFFKNKSFKRAAIFAVPAAVYFLWQGYVFLRIGELPITHGPFRAYQPFEGQSVYHSLSFVPLATMIKVFINKFSQIDSYGFASNFTVDISLMFFYMIGIALSVRAVKNKENAASMPLLVFGFFSMFIGGTWIEFYGYGRTLAPLFLFLLAHFFATNDKIVLVPILGSLFPLFLFLKCAAVLP